MHVSGRVHLAVPVLEVCQDKFQRCAVLAGISVRLLRK